MTNTTVAKILSELKTNEIVEVCGWVKTFRANRFISLNDGSCLENIQCVIDFENTDEKILKNITTGSAINISGKIAMKLEENDKIVGVKICKENQDIL